MRRSGAGCDTTVVTTESAQSAGAATSSEVGQELDADALVLRRAVPEPERDLDAVGADAERHDAAAALELQSIEHQRGQPNVGQRAGHQRLEVLAGPADELAADPGLRRRALRVDDVLADGLTRAREPTRAHAGEHLLEHDCGQRVAVGEVRVGRHLHLAGPVGGTHPRTLHRHASAAERDQPGFAAMPDRGAVGVVTALRTDHVVDLFSHQLSQHPEPYADAQRQQALLRSAGQLAQRLLHTLRKRIELRVADRVGTFVYVLHGGSPRLLDLFALATVPAGPDEAWRTATSSSTSYGTTSSASRGSPDRRAHRRGGRAARAGAVWVVFPALVLLPWVR